MHNVSPIPVATRVVECMFKCNDRVRLVKGAWNREHGSVRSIRKIGEELKVDVVWDVDGCLQPYKGGQYLPVDLEFAPQVYPNRCVCNEHRVGCVLCTVSSDDAKAEPAGVGFSPLLEERNSLREQVRILTKSLAEKKEQLDNLYLQVCAVQRATNEIKFPKEWLK